MKFGVWKIPLVYGVTALTALAIFLCAISLSITVTPQEHYECQQATEYSSTAKPEDCPTSETIWQKTISEPVAYYTGWLTLFTLVLASIGIAQSISINDQTKLARDEFLASHPPELVMRDVRWTNNIDKVDIIAFTLANRGGSTAEIVESIFRPRSSLNETEVLETEGRNELPISLAPGEFRAITTEMTSTGEQVMAAALAMQIFEDHYFRGTIIYAAPSGIRRRMVFTRKCKKSELHFTKVDNPDLDYTD